MKVESSDLGEIFLQSENILPYFCDARIFMTGGTGYLGKWMIEFLYYARKRACLNFELVLLSRNIQAFLTQYPELAKESWFSYVEGDIRDFSFPEGNFTHIIHAATDVVAAVTPLDTFEVTVLGTRRILEFAKDRGARDVLIVSSGAIYGVFPDGVDHISESFFGRVDVNSSRAAYGLGKLTSEWLSNIYTQQSALRCKIARMFAQVGPHLDLDAHFAIGNFIRNVLDKKSLRIEGDGTPVRSYMYATDLVAWLLKIWLKGEPGSAYNVGSEEAISIRDLADLVASTGLTDSLQVNVFGHSITGAAPNHYLPDTTLAQRELGLSITVPLKEAIERTINWHRRQSNACSL